MTSTLPRHSRLILITALLCTATAGLVGFMLGYTRGKQAGFEEGFKEAVPLGFNTQVASETATAAGLIRALEQLRGDREGEALETLELQLDLTISSAQGLQMIDAGLFEDPKILDIWSWIERYRVEHPSPRDPGPGAEMLDAFWEIIPDAISESVDEGSP